ncbi:hypothetical protein PISMIDRAFT_685966, partial [Pisolithus microcarpus 441]
MAKDTKKTNTKTNAKLVVYLCGLWLKGSVENKKGRGFCAPRRLGQRWLVLLMKGEQGKTEKVKIFGSCEPRCNV